MKETRLWLILGIMLVLIFGSVTAFSQSFYANKYEKGRSSQLNGKTVMHKKQVNAYQQHSLLYKIRRDNAHNKKRKQQAKTR